MLECQKDDSNLFIGFITKQTLKKLLEYEISPNETDRFFDGIRAFYNATYEYCTKWLPLDNDLSKSCRFIDFSRRLEFSFHDEQSIVSAFPQLNQNISNNVYKLDGHQEMSGNEILQHVWELAKVNENLEEGKVYYRMDIIWVNFRTNLPTLANVVLQVLTIPHSNAAEERAFSMINKNKTQFCSPLNLGKSLNSIILIKMNTPEGLVPCHKMKFSEELHRKCKFPCMYYNKKHSSSS